MKRKNYTARYFTVENSERKIGEITVRAKSSLEAARMVRDNHSLVVMIHIDGKEIELAKVLRMPL